MTQTRRIFSAWLPVFGIATAFSAIAAETPPARPNIVVILADDVGWGDAGCYGATKVKTPHIDRLAREGQRFENGHASAAVCTPTRYSLITGQYSWRQSGERFEQRRRQRRFPAAHSHHDDHRAGTAQASRLPHRPHRQMASRLRPDQTRLQSRTPPRPAGNRLPRVFRHSRHQ